MYHHKVKKEYKIKSIVKFKESCHVKSLEKIEIMEEKLTEETVQFSMECGVECVVKCDHARE
jgi:hypothetical protein